MFLGPKPELADFLVKCLLHYKTLFDKNLDPKSHPCWHKDPKTEKKFNFFQMDAVFRSKGQRLPILA